jgi:hypothetical protein
MKHPIQHFEEMKWQDKVFATGEIVFLVSLFPTLFSSDKPSPITAFATAFMLYCFLLVHRSYGLWVTFTLAAITASIWFAIGVQGVLS